MITLIDDVIDGTARDILHYLEISLCVIPLELLLEMIVGFVHIRKFIADYNRHILRKVGVFDR